MPSLFFETTYLECKHSEVSHQLTILTLRDHLTSSVMWPFDNPYAISYRCSVVCCNRGSISSHFRDIRPQKHVRTNRHTPQVILYSVPCNVLHWTDNLAKMFSICAECAMHEAITTLHTRQQYLNCNHKVFRVIKLRNSLLNTLVDSSVKNNYNQSRIFTHNTLLNYSLVLKQPPVVSSGIHVTFINNYHSRHSIRRLQNQ